MDPWSKGDYSRHILEALIVVEKLLEVNPPSDRVPRQVRRAVPILESPRRGNRGGYRKNKRLSRVFVTGNIYGPKGGTRGCHHPSGALLARARGGSHQVAACEGGGPP